MSCFFGRKPNQCHSSIIGSSNNCLLFMQFFIDKSLDFLFPNKSNSTVPRFAAKPYILRTGLKNPQHHLMEQISFLCEFVTAFKEQTPTDIQLKPNDGQPCIPAHRALLAARSEIFRSMVESDDVDIVTLSELNTEELKCLLYFLYIGCLTWSMLEKHVCSMYVAAEKYEIPYLQEYCERYILETFDKSNVVKMLEFSNAHSNETIKEATIKFILQNMKDLVSTKAYRDFATRNPHLAMKITRRLVGAKSHNYTRTCSTVPRGSSKRNAIFMGSNVVEHLKRRVNFLCEFVEAFEEQTPTDILLKPNDGQPCIPAHKDLLAARSKIFKNIFELDGCKAPPSDADIVTLSEFNTDELKSLLQFLYTGCWPWYKWEKHVCAMYVAADKYDIPNLQKFCEQYMYESLATSNALKMLELSDAHSNQRLKRFIIEFVGKNMKNIVSTKGYDDFAPRNPHLVVQITSQLVS